MRIGCCGSMISPKADPVGIEIIEPMVGLGFDYIELSLADVAALDPPSFSALARRVERSGISCEACNNFFPAGIRLTGPDADLGAAIDYAGAAIARAAALGATIIVFGSSGAKNVPAGFPRGAAWKQLVALLRALGPVAGRHGVTIAIEHLNRLESNIVNLAAEGLELASQVGHPSIQLLIDYYHLVRENEELDIVTTAAAAIRHVHFAEGEARIFPDIVLPKYVAFFDLLRATGYSSRCSIEAYTKDFAADAGPALAALRKLT